MWKPSGPRAESCSALHVTPSREEEEEKEGGFTSLYPHHLLYLKHESTLGCTTAAPKVPIPMPAYPFELFFFFPRKHHTCDQPLSTSPSGTVKHKDTDTTSGLGSPEAANCRKLREYNVESIPLLGPRLAFLQSSSPQSQPGDGYQQS